MHMSMLIGWLGTYLPEPEVKVAMKLALKVGKDVIRRQPITYLDAMLDKLSMLYPFKLIFSNMI